MCGGEVLTVPCSRVAHAFKPHLPYSFKGAPADVVTRNLVRVAAVWMDDFSKYYYAQLKAVPSAEEVGSLLLRKQLRRDLKCKSFEWYLQNVTPELQLPPENVTFFG